jgi:hypothetical protein
MGGKQKMPFFITKKYRDVDHFTSMIVLKKKDTLECNNCSEMKIHNN